MVPGLREDERYHRFARGDPAAFYGYDLGEREGAGFEAGIPVVDKDDAFVCQQYIVQATVNADAVGSEEDRLAAVQVIVSHNF